MPGYAGANNFPLDVAKTVRQTREHDTTQPPAAGGRTPLQTTQSPSLDLLSVTVLTEADLLSVVELTKALWSVF